MSILLTLLVALVVGMFFGIALERWWPEVQGKVDALNDYWIGAEVCDAGNLLMGVFLILSPWVFEFDTSVQSQNAVVSGIVIVVLSIAAFVGYAAWEDGGIWPPVLDLESQRTDPMVSSHNRNRRGSVSQERDLVQIRSNGKFGWKKSRLHNEAAPR